MNSPTLTALLALTTTSAVLAQDPLRITGFDTGYTGVWGQHIEDGQVGVLQDVRTPGGGAQLLAESAIHKATQSILRKHQDLVKRGMIARLRCG